MKQNKLKLNDSKTEVLNISASWRTGSISSLRIGCEEMSPSCKARNLGVVFTNDLKLDQQVHHICCAAANSLRKIGRIRKYLDKQSTERLVHAFISSRLDNCNSLFGSSSSSTLHGLQRIHNSAARIISRSRKFEHITPTLKELHWLPIKFRIDFKTLLLTYKCLHGLTADYLMDLISPYIPSRSLRSASEHQLCCAKYSLERYGRRAFSVNAPILWNKLPSNIKAKPSVDSFKAALKTYLFENAFPS